MKINYWAAIIIGLIAFMLSLLWYSPVLFGKIWEQYRHAPNTEIPQWTMVFAPLREFTASLVLAMLIIRLGLRDWRDTAGVMLLLWFAFHLVGMAGAILWDNMNWKLGAVHAGDWLMKMLFMGITYTIWNNRKHKEEIS
jgi:hypothetical protein